MNILEAEKCRLLESVELIKVPDEIATNISRATKLLLALSPAKELLKPQVYQR